MRSFLARFLFVGDDVFKRVADLSGGEKGRLALAKLIYSNVNVLILDEPTNHLDIPSREALEDALLSYQGTIITVSHDRYFLDKITTQIFAFEENKKVEVFNGNYSEFHDWREAQSPKSKAQSLTVAQISEKDEQQTNLSKNQQQRIERRIAEIEKTIPRLEEELANITLQMSLPKVATNHTKLQEVSQNFSETERKIQSLYKEWEDLLI